MVKDATATETLEPIDRIDLAQPLTSDYQMVPTARGTDVVVAFSQETIDVLGLAAHYHPEIVSAAALALIGGTLLLLWRRRRNRPQARPGEPYCRRCGYGLTGVVSTQCPECGEGLDERAVRIAPRRRRVWRVMWMMWIALVLGGGAAWLIWGPPRDQPIMQDTVWPSAWARRVTAGKLGSWSDRLTDHRQVLQVIHTPDGRRRTIASGKDIEEESWPDPMPHRFEVVVNGEDHFEVFDLATGKRRGRLASPHAATLLGGPYVSRHGEVIYSTTSGHFVRWDSDTLRPLPSIPKPAELTGKWWWYFACPLDDGVMVLVDDQRLLRIEPGGAVVYAIEPPPGSEGFSSQWPTTSDGRAFLRGIGGDPQQVYEHDLTDGSLRRTWRFGSEVTRCALSDDDRYLLVVSQTPSGEEVTAWSVADQRPLARLDLPGPTTWRVENADFSHDNQRIVVLAQPGSAAAPVILSYDATALPSP